MRPSNVESTLLALSAPRLSNYKSFFNVADNFDLYSCYQWNSDLSKSFLSIIHLVELSLRNSYHRELSLHYSYKITGANSASFPWYDYINLSSKSLKAISKIKQKHQRPDDVISRLTFGFWANLAETKNVSWADIHKSIFPNFNRHFNKPANHDWLLARLKMINDLRNRIAHWEPIWKLGPLYEETIPRQGKPPKLLQPATKSPSQSLARLNSCYDRMRSLIAGIDNSLAATYNGSYAHKNMLWICSEQGLFTYRNSNQNTSKTFTEVKRTLRKIIKNKNHVTITLKGQPKAVIQPQ